MSREIHQRKHLMLRSTAALAAALALSTAAQSAPPPEPPQVADAWISTPSPYPPPFGPVQPQPETFAGLNAQISLGQLTVLCPRSPLTTDGTVQLHASVDWPGHWPARDWRAHPMIRRGDAWEAACPVFDLDLPIVYYVSLRQADTTLLSPMRVCYPRPLGLPAPTRLFWPFLDGFEEGMESWRAVTPSHLPLHITTNAHVGRAALAVEIPEDRHSVTIATTRLRPWHLWKFNYRGLRLWLRVSEGTARVRFSLLGNAFTSNQVAAAFPQPVVLNPTWQSVALPFAAFPALPRSTVDLFTIEFIAQGPRQLLVDDLELMDAPGEEF